MLISAGDGSFSGNYWFLLLGILLRTLYIHSKVLIVILLKNGIYECNIIPVGKNSGKY